MEQKRSQFDGYNLISKKSEALKWKNGQLKVSLNVISPLENVACSEARASHKTGENKTLQGKAGLRRRKKKGMRSAWASEHLKQICSLVADEDKAASLAFSLPDFTKRVFRSFEDFMRCLASLNGARLFNV